MNPIELELWPLPPEEVDMSVLDRLALPNPQAILRATLERGDDED